MLFDLRTDQITEMPFQPLVRTFLIGAHEGLYPATSEARAAASLRSTRSVAKAVLPNRMGRIDYRLSGRILTANATAAIPFQ